MQLRLLDQMPHRQRCQSLSASALSNPIADFCRPLGHVDAFQVRPTHYFFSVSIFDDKWVPGSGGKVR